LFLKVRKIRETFLEFSNSQKNKFEILKIKKEEENLVILHFSN
jgi:hypothetical protein